MHNNENDSLPDSNADRQTTVENNETVDRAERPSDRAAQTLSVEATADFGLLPPPGNRPELTKLPSLSLTGNAEGAAKRGFDSDRNSASLLTTEVRDEAPVVDKQRPAEKQRSAELRTDEFERGDGSKLQASFKGDRLEVLKEIGFNGDTQRETTWSRERGSALWRSDDTPPRYRKNIAIARDGSLRFTDMDGTRHLLLPNGDREVAGTDQIARRFDKENRLIRLTTAEGQRTFSYTGDQLVKIATRTKSGEVVSTREPGSKEWRTNGRRELRTELSLNSDGVLSFKNRSGNTVKETPSLIKIEADKEGRPLNVGLPSGSSRQFGYAYGKLMAVRDSVKQGNNFVNTTFLRTGSDNDFAATVNGVRSVRKIIERPFPNGDYTYETRSKRVVVSEAKNLDSSIRPESPVKSRDYQAARENLLKSAQDRGMNTKRMEDYLDDLEKNTTKFKTKPEQLTKAVANLTEALLKADKSPHYNREQVKNVVETALHNIAKPMEINQGKHPTCNVTTLEVYSAAKRPEEYTRLIKEVTLTGKYTTADGAVVTPPRNSLTPGENEKSYSLDSANSGLRNLASQIIQMTLVNGIYETGRVPGKNSRDRRYVLGKPASIDLPNGRSIEFGEDRLVNTKTGAMIGRSPNLRVAEVLAASKMMLGTEMPYLKPTTIRTPQHALVSAEALFNAKENNKFPIGVTTSGGRHVQTIFDVMKDKQGKVWVLLDNQHGQHKDGWVTLDDLHKTQTKRQQLYPTVKPHQVPGEIPATATPRKR